MSLFRKEVIAHQQQRLAGEVRLSQPMSLKITLSVFVVTLGLLLLFFANSTYSRKHTVRGYIQPESGFIKTHAKHGGVIDELKVVLGQQVKKGQVLAILSMPHYLGDGQSVNQDLENLTSNRISLLERQAEVQDKMFELKLNELDIQQQNLAFKIENAQLQYKALAEKQVILEKQLQEIEALHQQGFASQTDYDHKLASVLTARANLSEQLANKTLLKKQQHQLSNNEALVRQEQESNQAQYGVELAKLKSELTQLRSQSSYVISANQSGVLSSLYVVQGEELKPGELVAKIIPNGDKLVAELLLPSWAAGQLKVGMKAQLRLDAYPYQKFGFITANIKHIDQTVTLPNEKELPLQFQQPIYRLIAEIDKDIQLKKATMLKAGLLLSADLIVDSRTIWQWLTSPIVEAVQRVS